MIKQGFLNFQILVELLKLLINFFFYFVTRSQEILQDKEKLAQAMQESLDNATHTWYVQF